eukprot:TRINITY_DN2649_c0_g1_i1.p1 TRINITY_DN2649_c0_g1~~TRINITY_DN2649_c0_g1_i1.p1  ORF type:complete len:345 (-),score=72.13 TRINITY_DN2649_c0_g1_i1:150-1049(-)
MSLEEGENLEAREVFDDVTAGTISDLCNGVTTPSEVAKFLGKSREPILEGALINVHYQLACAPVLGKPHQILITDHHLWHDYIDYFAGSKPNQTKNRVNRNKSFSSRWFKMPPGRKPKSFIIETYPARRKDVERKLAIVRSKVGDKNSPKTIKIGNSIKTFTPPDPVQLLILSHRKPNYTEKSNSAISIQSEASEDKKRSSRKYNTKNLNSEDEEDWEDEQESSLEYPLSSPPPPKKRKIKIEDQQLEVESKGMDSREQDGTLCGIAFALSEMNGIAGSDDSDLETGTYLLNFLRTSAF